MSGKAQPCRHCGRAVVMRMTRSGRALAFDNELIPVDSEYAEDLRYVPTAGNMMAPIADLNPRRLEGVRWHAIRHVCAEWLRARKAEREAGADRSRAVNWRGEVATALHEGDTTPPADEGAVQAKPGPQQAGQRPDQAGHGADQTGRGKEQDGRGKEQGGRGADQTRRSNEQRGRGADQTGQSNEQGGRDADQARRTARQGSDQDADQGVGGNDGPPDGELWAAESGWPVPENIAERRRNATPRGGSAGKSANGGKARPPRRNGQ